MQWVVPISIGEIMLSLRARFERENERERKSESSIKNEAQLLMKHIQQREKQFVSLVFRTCRDSVHEIENFCWVLFAGHRTSHHGLCNLLVSANCFLQSNQMWCTIFWYFLRFLLKSADKQDSGWKPVEISTKKGLNPMLYATPVCH